jgi:hypothetical protein
MMFATMARLPNPHRRAPGSPAALVVVLEYEGDGGLWLAAESHEDELRLRLWLCRSRVFQWLPTRLERLLDDLDQIDELDRAA